MTLALTQGIDDVLKIRAKFKVLEREATYVSNGNERMLEIFNCSFVADKPSVFGVVNEDWNNREMRWYMSKSRNVQAIEPPVPKIWQDVAGYDGSINSNYGWCIWSDENGRQYQKAIDALVRDPESRQAIMIYTNPKMHELSKEKGMSDFMCTNTVQLLIRGGSLQYMVSMRSSDAVYGYKGDWHWHNKVHDQALVDLQHRTRGITDDISKTLRGLKKGSMFWNAGSFHVYPRHHSLVRRASIATGT